MLENNQKGQSIFEFIVFVPFLILMLQVFMNVGGSINGSINQQKAVRSYFFHKLKNSSFFPSLNDLTNLSGIENVSYSAFGWSKELVGGKQPKAPCYLLNNFFGEPIDTCDDLTEKGEGKSQFVRVYSVFGLCTGVFTKNDSGGWDYQYSISPTCVNTN